MRALANDLSKLIATICRPLPTILARTPRRSLRADNTPDSPESAGLAAVGVQRCLARMAPSSETRRTKIVDHGPDLHL
jgi:hypothetical protein